MTLPSETRPVRLRGHHLLCLRTYRGHGYPASFATNVVATIARLEDRPVLVVEGPDDICAACPDLLDGACIHDTGPDSEIRRLDDLGLELLDLTCGATLSYADILNSPPGIWGAWRARACSACEFVAGCEEHP